MKVENINSLALAYIGDAIYEVEIRKYLLEQNIFTVQKLQKAATKYVSAKNQAYFLKEMLKDDFFTPEEADIIYRARNHKVGHKPKNSDIITYKYSTGLEAIIGWLYLKGNLSRIDQIMNFIKGVDTI